MALRIAIVGASGAVGSALLMHMLKSSILSPGDEIVLLGRGTPESTGRLFATRIDLLDAFDEAAVRLVVCKSVEDLNADVVIIAAGETIVSLQGTRRELAEANLPVFESLAQRFARSNTKALFLTISNPVELAVSVFARYLDPVKVVGMGAQQDSLRFARAIASKLGVHRSLVRASVLGEHGDWMVPTWSSVHLTVDDSESASRLESLKAQYSHVDIRTEAANARKELARLINRHEIDSAYQLMEKVAPSTRILIEPFITQTQIHSTPNATANATLELLAAALSADGRRVHGQVALRGEYHGIHGVCGVPLNLRLSGWEVRSQEQLTSPEIQQLLMAAAAINTARLEYAALD